METQHTDQAANRQQQPRSAVIKLGGAAIDKLTVSADGSSAAGLIPSRPIGADVVDVLVANSNGASFVLPNGFKYTA